MARVMETKKVLTAAFVVFLLCVSAGSVRAYTSSSNFFSFEEPSGWTADETVQDAAVMFYEPMSENGTVFINIVVQSVSSTMTLAAFVTAVKDQYPSLVDSFVIISESARVINDINAYEIVAAVTYQGNDFIIKQIILVRNLRVYIVTYAAVTAQYQQFLPDFEDSIETFTIIDPIPWYFWYVFVGAIVAAVAAIAAGLYIYKRRANTPITSY